MFSSSFIVPLLAAAALGMAAVPMSIALEGDGGSCELVSVVGTVTEFVCCNEECDCDLEDERAGAFMLETLDGEMVMVEFGPWWYWETQDITVRDVVAVGDEVNVTGELQEDEDMTVMMAWKIKNLDTGEEITIKVEGSPPWAGGPIKLGIEPWPPSEEED